MSLDPADEAAIRAAERRLAESFEDADPTAWVDRYTEDVVFVGPESATIEGRAGLLAVAPQVTMSSLQIDADSTIGTGGFAVTTGRATWVSGPKGSESPVTR